MDINICKHFNGRIKAVLNSISSNKWIDIQEIRLRTGKPLCFSCFGITKYAGENGCLTNEPLDGYIVTQQDIDDTFNSICQYSIHSFQRELCGGFITVFGGHRVGLCGTAVYSDENIQSIKHISGLNFRIARQVIGCADEISNKLFHSGLQSVLVIGPPSSGKTTILRDLCRHLGKRYKISVIDERGEIAAVFNGIPQNDIGINTDVFDGYKKSDGIEMAVRVMSPEIIVCDEIGTSRDADAIINLMNSGVKLIASAHAGGTDELKKRPYIVMLIKAGVFDHVVVLDGMKSPGTIKNIVRTDNNAETYWNDTYCDNDKSDRMLYV